MKVQIATNHVSFSPLTSFIDGALEHMTPLSGVQKHHDVSAIDSTLVRIHRTKCRDGQTPHGRSERTTRTERQDIFVFFIICDPPSPCIPHSPQK